MMRTSSNIPGKCSCMMRLVQFCCIIHRASSVYVLLNAFLHTITPLIKIIMMIMSASHPCADFPLRPVRNCIIIIIKRWNISWKLQRSSHLLSTIATWRTPWQESAHVPVLNDRACLINQKTQLRECITCCKQSYICLIHFLLKYIRTKIVSRVVFSSCSGMCRVSLRADAARKVNNEIHQHLLYWTWIKHNTDNRTVFILCLTVFCRCVWLILFAHRRCNRVILLISLRWPFITSTYLTAMAAVFITASGTARNRRESPRKRLKQSFLLCFLLIVYALYLFDYYVLSCVHLIPCRELNAR